MRLRVRCCPLGKPAADGSIVSVEVAREYLQSEDYKLSVDGRLTLGYLTHRGRQLQTLPAAAGNTAALSKTVGKDDAGLIIADGAPSFTHYVESFYIDDDVQEDTCPWLCAVVKVLDEDGFDEKAADNIKRLKALIRSGVRLTCSLVIVAFWGGSNSELCSKIKRISSLDWTINPSFGPLARITEVIDDSDVKEDIEKNFSEIEEHSYIAAQPQIGELRVKAFSMAGMDLTGIPKSSKINGTFTTLKAKQFSAICDINEIVEESMPKQKEFTAMGIKDRLREAKIGEQSPRMYFRRMYISYKQVLKSVQDEKEIKLLKSMFASDILYILNKVQNDIIKGKQINTLLGCSSLSQSCRKAAQQLQMPFRYAMQEVARQGFVSKMRYQKLQDAYLEFVKALTEDVFGDKSSDVPESEENEIPVEGKE